MDILSWVCRCSSQVKPIITRFCTQFQPRFCTQFQPFLFGQPLCRLAPRPSHQVIHEALSYSGHFRCHHIFRSLRSRVTMITIFVRFTPPSPFPPSKRVKCRIDQCFVIDCLGGVCSLCRGGFFEGDLQWLRWRSRQRGAGVAKDATNAICGASRTLRKYHRSTEHGASRGTAAPEVTSGMVSLLAHLYFMAPVALWPLPRLGVHPCYGVP